MKTSRRQFVRTAGFLALGFTGLKNFVQTNHASKKLPLMATIPGYGPLQPDPNRIFDLPKGFQYQVIARKGQKLSDGLLLPGAPDGMAAFPGEKGNIILIMNHELGQKHGAKSGAFGEKNQLLTKQIKNKIYDGGKKKPMLGGTSTLVYNPSTKKVEAHFLSLMGTERNCAGGMTPWNSWITCEETDGLKAGGAWEKDHGYNFEVPASSKGLVDPQPLKAMGCFRHEAVAVEPITSIVYQTEDQGDGLIYRFIPKTKGKLEEGGKLQALAIKNHKTCDTRNWEETEAPEFKSKTFYSVEWIDLENVESPRTNLRKQGQEKGAAVFARGEGMWYGNSELYWACTNGGKIKQGQIFRYRPSPYEGTPRESEKPGRIELFLESVNGEVLGLADNLTVSNWGDLFIAEDPYGERRAKVVGITPKGECYDVGRNSYNASEMAGVCFSPDYSIMFVNIQKSGITLAITGPWDKKVS